MCVNDIVVMGAEPLFFLDYLACGKLSVQTAVEIIEGISKGCSMANCSLLGGETAEMPGIYQNDNFDITGFSVGVIEKDRMFPRKVNNGDLLFGLKSTGVHSNGFTLIRKLLEILFAKKNSK